MKSLGGLGLRFDDDACFSSTHAKAARAVGIHAIGIFTPTMQEEQHDDGFRGIGVIRSRVYVREQTGNIQCSLFHIIHFAIARADFV